MLPALLGAGARAVGGQMVKSGGRAVASNIMGRKKTVSAAAVSQPQQQRRGRGGALVKSPTAAIAKQMAPIKQIATGSVAKDDYLGIIHQKVLVIESIVKGVRNTEKDNIKEKKKAEQDESRANQEKKLEAKDDKPEKKTMKMPPVQKLGIFGWIKRFIGNVIASIFLTKMVDHVGVLVGFVKAADKILNFVADVGLKIVDALGTMVDFGYRAYDATRGFLQTIGGSPLANNFDKVLGLVGTALTLATAITLDAAMDAASGGGDGPGLLDFIKGRGAAQGATTAATTGGGGAASTAGTVGGVAVGTAAAIITGVGLLASALGEGAFQIKKLGKKPIEDAERQFKKYGWLNPMKYFWGAALGMQKMMLFPLTFTGYVLDVIGAPFRYAIELIRFGIMALMGDTEGMKKQRYNLAKFDARIRESIREMLNMLTLGLAFTEKGSFGNIFGDDKATKEMASKMEEGGKVKGSGKGKVKRGISSKRRVKKLILKKPPRDTLNALPPRVEDTDDPKQKKNRQKSWWDFLGWAGTGGDEPLGPGGEKLAEKVSNVGNELGKNDFFGPILRVTSKIILGQKPDPSDYKSVGLGLNLLINEGIKKEKVQQGLLGFAEGGEVSGIANMPIDVSKWVQDSFGESMRREGNKTFTGTTTTGGKKTTGQDGGLGGGTGGQPGSGGGSTNLTGSNVEKWKAIYAMAQKAGAKYPELVAAQFALESAWGTALAADNNFFGIKATGSEDATVSNTREVVNGQSVYVDARFKNFATPQDAINHLVNQWYKDYKGYRGVNNASDAFAAALMLKSEGYATDPVYAQSLQRLMNEYANVRGREEDIASFVRPGTVPTSLLSSNAGADIKVGGSNIVNIGKDLASKGFAVAEHPDFTKNTSGGKYTPGQGYVSNVHKGRGHYEGRALDVTDHRGSLEDSKARYRSVLTSLQNNPAIKMLIHDSWGGMYGGPGTKQGPGGHGHPTHMHIEVKDRGGFIGKGLFVNLGGTEFVTDADSTAALKQEAPGLMMALNQAKNRAGVAKVLQQYASYEQGAPQTVIIDDSPKPQESSDYSQGSGSEFMPMIEETESPFDFLDYQG